MSETPPLPLHDLLEELDTWQADPTSRDAQGVQAAFERLFAAYEVAGASLITVPPEMAELEVRYGTLANERRQPTDALEFELRAQSANVELGRLLLEGRPATLPLAARAVELALDAAWSRAEARASERRLAALDAAVRGIAGVLDLDRVLQLIVDRVRELVGAQYAALGIIGQFEVIDRFITSGISREHRERIGPLPRGRGLLGLIIHEDRSFRIDDIATDPRRFGFPPHHPEMHAFLGVPVRSEGRSIGNLYLTNKHGGRPFSEADQRLVEMFALHAGIAIENVRLHEEVQRLAIVDERQRISRELHDSIIQSLYGVGLSLEDLPDLVAEDPAEGISRLDRAIDALHQSIRDIRNFILGLSPEALDEADLATGLHSLSAEFELNTMIDLEVRIDEPLPSLPPSTAAHVLAMTREGLSNIARHSGATRASLELGAADGTLRLIIGDNGRGFEVDEGRSREMHGLANLRARAESLGGTLVVQSEPSVGTRLEARIPSTTEAEPAQRGEQEGS
jgi:signal transduction histidine kinase